MFRLLPGLPPHVVGFVLDGTVTRPDVDALFREVEGVMARGHVHLVGEITGVGGLTLDAVGAQFSRAFGLVTKIGKVDRYAVVTDTGWIEAMAKAQGTFLPGLDVQVWPRAERDDAVAWASEPLAS
ncbi:STAS/SEC14 domain-containing protein [Rubrivirga sp. IMCC43871]|uniref:STAS/SEC14 domain-containing protein n=1 Tax=Rubrivirga sp. IMCC43871 TaxID=3391575 RepID=UPI00399004B1